MELTARLRVLAELVPQDSRLADVGTDHAYLPVWLILQGRISRAIAADLREGPLGRARETAQQYHVMERIEFRLCDGLSAISPEEVDTISIAGMGGETIASILQDAPWSREKRLLLQPMTSFPDLRGWLQEHQYRIESEHIAREGNRLYTIWVVKGGRMEPLTPAELWVGKQEGTDPLRADYLNMMEHKIRRALSGMLASKSRDKTQIDLLQQILEGIQDMQKELT